MTTPASDADLDKYEAWASPDLSKSIGNGALVMGKLTPSAPARTSALE